jgi:hypothetical protein
MTQAPKPQPTAQQTAAGCGCLLLVFVALALGLGMCMTPPKPKNPNLNENEVGKPLEMGRTGCERVLKGMLRDPESLQRGEYTITEASPTAWAATMNFRSRNGFGGMNPMQAVCTFDGTQYTVKLVGGQ